MTNFRLGKYLMPDSTDRIARRLAALATKTPERMARQKARDVRNMRRQAEDGELRETVTARKIAVARRMLEP